MGLDAAVSTVGWLIFWAKLGPGPQRDVHIDPFAGFIGGVNFDPLCPGVVLAHSVIGRGNLDDHYLACENGA